MSKYEIEKEFPIPEFREHGSKYPWKDMEVGDSIKVDIYEKAKVMSSAHAFGIRRDIKFISRHDRIWRVK